MTSKEIPIYFALIFRGFMQNRSAFPYLERSLLFTHILQQVEPYRYLPEGKVLPYAYMNHKSNLITDISEVPHHVLIVYGSKYCSGSLTGSRTVVTAASCFEKNNGEPIVVKVGSSSMIGSGQIIPVLEYKAHEYFQHLSSLDNDVALLILQNHVVFGSNVIKIPLVEPEVALRVGIPVRVTGWGGTDLPVKYLNLVLQSDMIVLTKTECRNVHGSLITPSNFCAKYVAERRLSDNGGGAIFENILVGILSWGASGKKNYNVAIFTNVSYFQRWITLNTKRFLTKYCSIKENQKQFGLLSEEYIDT